MYVLTRNGRHLASKYICDMISKRKQILEEQSDTGQKVTIPTYKDIETNINRFGIDWEYPSGPCYFNYLDVTDNTKADYPIILHYGVDFIDDEYIPFEKDDCDIVETYSSGTFYRMIPGTIVIDSKYNILWKVKSNQLLNIELEEVDGSQTDKLILQFKNSEPVPFNLSLLTKKYRRTA